MNYTHFLQLRNQGNYKEAYQEILEAIKHSENKTIFIFEAIRYCIWTDNEEFDRKSLAKIILTSLVPPFSVVTNLMIGYLIYDGSKNGYQNLYRIILSYRQILFISDDDEKLLLLIEDIAWYENGPVEIVEHLAKRGHFRSQVQMYYLTKELHWLDSARMQKYKFGPDLVPVVEDLQMRKQKTRVAMLWTSLCMKRGVVFDKNLRQIIVVYIWTMRYDDEWKKELRRSRRRRKRIKI